jgi:hypothetical protein
VRRQRFTDRVAVDPADAGGVVVFDALVTDEIERAAESLGDVADFRVDTTAMTEDEVYAAVSSFLDGRGAIRGDAADGVDDATSRRAEHR